MRNGTTRLGAMNLGNGKVGAGGFTTGFSIAADGKKMVRTDTWNAYMCPVGVSGQWAHELRPGINCNVADIDIFYGGDPHPWGQCGTYDVAIAPSNSSVRYMVCMGYVWVTQDDGTSWTRCALAQRASCKPNETNRMSGKPLAVDPQNPAVVFFGSPQGVQYSTDYGANWTAISTGTIPTPTNDGSGNQRRYIIAFDPSSSVTGGRKQGIYIFANGTGLYRSTDGGTSWAAVSGAPTAASHMRVGSNGYVYLAGNGSNDNGQFYRWVPSGPTWTAPSGISCKAIAVSPHNAGHIYVIGAGGGIDVSTDYGVTFALGGGNGTLNTRVASSIGWQAYTDENYMTNGDMDFDPTVNRLWIAEGMGVWYLDSPPTVLTFPSRTVTLHEFSPGIENMVTTLVKVNDQGDVAYACHDRGLMIIPRASAGKASPSTHGGSIRFQHGGDLDWSPDEPDAWVGTIHGERNGAGNTIGRTTDKGLTWSSNRILRDLSGNTGGGCIVKFDANRWITFQTNRATPLAGNAAKNGIYRTNDAGATWTLCTIGDNEALNFHSAYNLCRRTLIGDKKTPGTAYALNMGDNSGSASDLACKGIWKTTDYGVTWTRVKAGFITNFAADFYHAKFTQGADANEWYFCGGDECLGLWRSTDGMATWAQVTGTDDINGAVSFGEVFGIGVGRPANGSPYPTLLAAGWRMASPTGASSATGYGFWISYDNGATWTRLAQFPNGIFDIVNDIAGDPTTFGRFYVGWGGTGLSMLSYDYSMRLT